MELLDQYFELQKKIYDYFGYQEDWRVLPLEDNTNYFWILDERDDGSGEVRYAETEGKLLDIDAGEYYSDEIFTYRHLPKWVYPAADYTMICVDTNTDGNKFLAVLDNAKRVKQ